MGDLANAALVNETLYESGCSTLKSYTKRYRNSYNTLLHSKCWLYTFNNCSIHNHVEKNEFQMIEGDGGVQAVEVVEKR
jgi:hypothetical protein